jgi:hypothetical protein
VTRRNSFSTHVRLIEAQVFRRQTQFIKTAWHGESAPVLEEELKMKTPTILVQAVTVLALTLAALPTQAAASPVTPTHSAAKASPAVASRKAHRSPALPSASGRAAVAVQQPASTPIAAESAATEKEHKSWIVIAYSVMSLLHLCLLLPGFSGRSLPRRDFALAAQSAA